MDKAIHRAGGPSILQECQQIAVKTGRLPAGKAAITTGGSLPAKYVIHTVGPFYHGGDRRESEILGSCYRECVRLADAKAITSLAFPAISTGAHRYPMGEAARIAVSAVVGALDDASYLSQVRFVLFDDAALRAYVTAGEEFAVLRDRSTAHDLLTGLNSNRTLFADLERLLKNPEQGFALLWLDMDDFKSVNDVYGHLAGDNVLRAVARVLSKQGTSYRIGGDEFASIMPSPGDTEAGTAAESIRSAIAGLVFEEYPDLKVAASIGIAISPEDGRTTEELVMSADSAMYRAKSL